MFRYAFDHEPRVADCGGYVRGGEGVDLACWAGNQGKGRVVWEVLGYVLLGGVQGSLAWVVEVDGVTRCGKDAGDAAA